MRFVVITNPTQYMPLCNPDKYEHTYDMATGFRIKDSIGL